MPRWSCSTLRGCGLRVHCFECIVGEHCRGRRLIGSSMPQIVILSLNVRYVSEAAFAGCMMKCQALQTLDLLLHTRLQIKIPHSGAALPCTKCILHNSIHPITQQLRQLCPSPPIISHLMGPSCAKISIKFYNKCFFPGSHKPLTLIPSNRTLSKLTFKMHHMNT